MIILLPIGLALIDQHMHRKKKKTTHKCKKNRKKVKKDSRIAAKESIDDVLYGECVEALRALGMKAMDAKIKTKVMFEKKKYDKVEDFLMEVYKNE